MSYICSSLGLLSAPSLGNLGEEVRGEIVCGEGIWGDDGCVEVDGCEVEGKFCWMNIRGSVNTSCEMNFSQDISCFSS